ncbi:MAG: hypothetical protein K940chlam2_01833 [Chlamydiae bacterium]|nr:hypothetical protein [Chlamydiota bacterium]
MACFTIKSITSGKHRRFSAAEWALDVDKVNSLDDIAQTIQPQDPLLLYRDRFGFSEPYLDSSSKASLEEERREAVDQIMKQYGMDGILQFAETVESPRGLGETLSNEKLYDFANKLFPLYLDNDNPHVKELVRGYIRTQQALYDWIWVDGLDKSRWSLHQKARFLSYLPFSKETWLRADSWLGKLKTKYWQCATFNTHQADKNDLEEAIRELIRVKRSAEAIECIYTARSNSHALAASKCLDLLLAVAESIKAPSSTIEGYHIGKLISGLQADPSVESERLFEVEWVYLPLLLENASVNRPLLTDYKLASDPEFFCQIIRIIYKSQNENEIGDPNQKPSKSLVQTVRRLLHDWNVPPGRISDGSFDGDRFCKFLSKVKELSTKTGHQESALEHIGRVLANTPPDPDGLWIHKSVADELNRMNAKPLRDGYIIGLFNSRGVHRVDPTGTTEHKLGEVYKIKAEQLDSEGYTRFASSLRKLADQYELQAERTKTDHLPLAPD